MKKKLLFCLLMLGIFLGNLGLLIAQDAVEENNQEDDKVFDLGNVIITAKGGYIDEATTVTSITIEDFEESGAQNVAEALELTPGIDIQMGTKGHASLKLRGFDQEDIKVLIDGIPAQETYFGSLDLDQIPINGIARIDVTKGASSVLYGANTMGGVINIITKKGGAEPETSVSVAYGQNATQEIVVNHGASVGKLNYWVTASTASSNGFSLSSSFDPSNDVTGVGTDYNEDGGVRDLSYYTKNTLNAKIGYEFDEDTKAYLSLDYHDNAKGCPTESSRYWAYTNWSQWHLNLVGEHAFSDLLSMKARLFYIKHDDTLEDVSWDNDHTTSRKWFETSSYNDYSMGMEVHTYLDFGNISLLKIGINYLVDNHIQQEYYDATTRGVVMGWDTAGIQPAEEYEAVTTTLAVEDEIMLGDNLLLIVGVSNDSYQPVKAHNQNVPSVASALNPQAGVVFDLSETTQIHGSVGQKTRFPQLKELYSEHTGGNPNLRPQKTMATEVGASMEFGESISTALAVFNNQITDKIDTVDDPVSGEGIYVNIGQATITGLELEVDYDITERINTGLSLTYLDSQEKVDSTSAFRVAENTPGTKIVLDMSYKFGAGWNSYAQVIQTGDQIYYDRNDNAVAVDPFMLINAKVSKDLESLFGFPSNAYLEMKNLMDVNYDEGSGPQPGRSFLLGMNMTF